MTCLSLRARGFFPSLSSGDDTGQNSSSISAISTYSRREILSASFWGNGGSSSPTYSPQLLSERPTGRDHGNRFMSCPEEPGRPGEPAWPDVTIVTSASAAAGNSPIAVGPVSSRDGMPVNAAMLGIKPSRPADSQPKKKHWDRVHNRP